MDVSNLLQATASFNAAATDVEKRVAAELERADGAIPIVVAAAGMGKSAVLRSAVRRAARLRSARVVFVSGRAVASAAHLDLIVASQLEQVADEVSTATVPTFSTALRVAAESTVVILAIDDLDALLYKRAPLLDALDLMLRTSGISVACTVGADTADRLVGPRGGVRTRATRPLYVFTLDPLDDQAASALALRRNAGLSNAATRAIVHASGGHPAAVAFLARFAAACPTGAVATGDLSQAAEFAGSVFAGPWASLGPQQRAILLALADAPVTQSASQIAQRLALSASHVSAQLTRLRAEALLVQSTRGQFTLPPLLAAWLRRSLAQTVPPADESPMSLRARSR